MDNRNNMLQLCRLCLVKDDVNIPIFEEHGDIRQIFLKISSCLPVKVSREDKLPKKICDGCSFKLDTLYEFCNTSANAEKQLLTWLGEAGMNSQMVDGTITAVTQQIKPTDTFVKEETIEPPDIHNEDDDDKDYMFQQKFEESASAGPSATVTSNEEEEPPPKRARRTAAVKAAIALDHDSDDDDDDSGEPMTKVEDESEESEGEDQEPSFADAPSTSADDQPGPSGVGKDGVEAPVIKHEDNKTMMKESTKSQLKPKKGRKGTVKNASKDKTDSLFKSKKERKSRRKSDSPKKIVLTHPPPIELEEPIQCEVCSASYTNNVDFAFHSLSHSDDGKYSCHMCNYRNGSKYHVEMHVRTHEGTTKHKCEICNKAFTISTHAIEHKNFHTGEKPFQCEICGKHFMFSWHLSSHRRTSHYEILTGKPLVKFDCAACNKHYESASGLRRHNIKKHKFNEIDLSVICEICGKRLSSKEKLKFHLRTHTGYKPHACHVCPKSFSKKDQLIEHIRTHTGEKPYVCKICGKGFAQRTPLKTHERTHNADRFGNTCTVCGLVFRVKDEFENHIKVCLAAQLPFPYILNYKTEAP
nr:zinc finger protein 37-like isoform X3 [Leptinotarsa decemlineata]